MNILLTSAGRRTYLVRYFKEALKKGGGYPAWCMEPTARRARRWRLRTGR